MTAETAGLIIAAASTALSLLLNHLLKPIIKKPVPPDIKITADAEPYNASIALIEAQFRRFGQTGIGGQHVTATAKCDYCGGRPGKGDNCKNCGGPRA